MAYLFDYVGDLNEIVCLDGRIKIAQNLILGVLWQNTKNQLLDQTI